ncbi:serine/threonine-protein kinase Nek4-like [Jatropha curcas]|uniref:serine/threonine-protein kinase Nek4-like n=1 Tax=Jatropha curcas TaxID=180498 RepID=UPI001894C616|nr:serine/threonine-protein kinase Nek4-like [Jatropha curcas]
MKCANILLTNNGGLKIADFGLTNLQNLLKAGRGIPAWSAPEFIDTKRQGEYGLTKADIWSLGCTVLEMLTEKLPYSGLETWSIWYRIGQGFWAMCKAVLLSQYKGMGRGELMESGELLLTVLCFFNFQEIKAFPRKIQYPVVDFLVSGHDAQSASQYAVHLKSLSASQYAVNLKSLVAGKNKPFEGVPFKYFKTCNAAL